MGVDMTGKDETLRGRGYDATNTLAASPGGGGLDKHPGATPLPHPDKECESCRGKGGEG